jgi:hypothetical protein
MTLKKKTKKTKVDGLGPEDVKKIRAAIRLVWQRSSYARKLCVERATHKDGFPRCELCKKKVPKIFVDHIEVVGDLDDGFIPRLWCPSSGLQALCKVCHQKKTNEERRTAKEKVKVGF